MLVGRNIPLRLRLSSNERSFQMQRHCVLGKFAVTRPHGPVTPSDVHWVTTVDRANSVLLAAEQGTERLSAVSQGVLVCILIVDAFSEVSLGDAGDDIPRRYGAPTGSPAMTMTESCTCTLTEPV